MYFFTSDEHYGHKNIIKYCDRPFKDIDEMDREIIKRHNEVVKPGDTVIHAGDFALCRNPQSYISKLNGDHIFIRGSHDRWMGRSYHEIWERTINGISIVVCHYPMIIWGKSHYGSFQLFGHIHKGGRHQIPLNGKQLNIGVDTNNFYPYSFDQIIQIMKDKPDNINLLSKTTEEK